MAGYSNLLKTSGGKLSCAILIQLILSLVQLIAGSFSGSLSLVADAMHNLGDAGIILVAAIARKIGKKSPDLVMTYGYKRAEIVGVLLNSSLLIAIGLFLICQAIHRYFHPSPVDGWIVFWVAGIAVIIDFVTAKLAYDAGANKNMNIRAVFIHCVADTLASVAVIIAGVLIILYQLYIVDAITTMGISLYVIYQGLLLLKASVRIIMQAAPEGVCVEKIIQTLETLENVRKVDNVHVWQLDDKTTFFDGCVLFDGDEAEIVKEQIRGVLKQQFNIFYSTIETTAH